MKKLFLLGLIVALAAFQASASVVSYMNLNNDADVVSETNPTWDGVMAPSGSATGYSNDVPAAQGHFTRAATFGTSLYLGGSTGGGNGLLKSSGTDLISAGTVSDFTVEAWLKDVGTSSSGDMRAILFGRGSDGWRTGPSMAYRSDVTTIVFGSHFSDGEHNLSWNYGTGLDPTEWHHFALTYDAVTGDFGMYVDGVLRDSDTLSTGLTMGNGVTDMSLVSGVSAGGNYWNGYIDDYRVSDTVINPSSDTASGWYGAIDGVAIPEPTTAGIAVMGALLVAARLRRRKA
jgi:hypothetical protein